MLHLLGIILLIWFTLKTLGLVLRAITREHMEYTQYKQVNETLKNSAKVLQKDTDQSNERTV